MQRGSEQGRKEHEREKNKGGETARPTKAELREETKHFECYSNNVAFYLIIALFPVSPKE